MPYLGDYLGQILSEIAMARAQADMETVRLAELYAAHPLLKTMPVPHIRLPDIDVDVPVLIKTSEEPRPGESTRGGAEHESLKSKFIDVLKKKLSESGIKLSSKEMTSIEAAVNRRLEKQDLPTETSVDVNRVADDLSSAALSIINSKKRAIGSVDMPGHTSFEDELKSSARLEFLKLRSQPPRLSVFVTGSELREAATTENITRLHLRIREEGLEWSQVETASGMNERLVPE